jgi:hypothetical protein
MDSAEAEDFFRKNVLPRAMVMQRKTQRPRQFEITEQTKQAMGSCIKQAHVEQRDSRLT